MNESIIKKDKIKIPNIFWKYYDCDRRGKISIDDFAIKSNLSVDEVSFYLTCV